ncbi:MFS transporter [Eggerthellaceae bacterium 24-137]
MSGRIGWRPAAMGMVGFGLNMLLGLVYSWSIFVGPLEADFGWARTDTSAVFSVSMVALCTGQLVSGALVARISSRTVMALAALLAAIGFLATAAAHDLAWICMSYGVMCGVAVGLGANCVLATVLPWFPDRRGTASGMLLAGVGLGTLLLGPAVAAVLTAWGWRCAFVVLAVVFGALLAAGALVLRPPREGEVASATMAPSPVPGAAATAGATPRQMVSTGPFWMFFAWIVLVSSGGLALVSNAVPAALDVLGAQDAAAFMIASTAMGGIGAFNAAGRMGTGWLWDRIGRRRSMAVVSCVYGFAMLACSAAVEAAFFPLVVIGFALLGLAYGGSVSVASAFIGTRFGMAHYAMNYALTNANLMVASVVGPAIAGASQVLAGTYLPAYLVIFVFACVALVLALVLPSQKAA